MLTGTTLGVVTDAYQYNEFGEVKNYSAQISGADQFVTGFIRDKLGRITQKTESVLNGPAKVTQYDYNPAGYLTTVTDITDPVNPVQLSSYSYDLNGNRLNNGAVYDDQDRLTSTSSATYTYTDNGELLTKTEGVDITQYKYDVLGNLLSVTLPSGTLIEYIIDGRNRRIGKKVDGILQQAWLYKDGLNPIAELDGAGNVIARFVYASRANVPDYVIKGGNTYRIISDHLGSPRLVVDTTTGAIAQQIEYDEWGNEAGVRLNDFPNPFSFAGGLYDADTKLIRFGIRDYDPDTGRWTSKDPVRFDGDGTNLYGYVSNDPINFADLFGLDRYVIIVGDPGLNDPETNLGNQGRNFDLAAATMKADLEKRGHDVTVKRASSFDEFKNAVESGELITGGVIYFGHSLGGEDNIEGIAPGEEHEPGTNVDFDNFQQISNSNLGPYAVIVINACAVGMPGQDAFVKALANHLDRVVIASTTNMSFSNVQGKFNYFKDINPDKPVYMVPDVERGQQGMMRRFWP